MDSSDKLFMTFIICICVAALALIGWGVIVSQNSHNFDTRCLQAGKTIQYQSLPGQAEPSKECK